MMKKLSLFLLTIILTICLISCDDGVQPVIPTPTPTPTEVPTPAPTEAPKLVDNITFRRGETINGELLFTGEALQAVSVVQDPAFSEHALNLQFTQEGATLLEKYSKELAASEEKLSVWIGEERIICAAFTEKITGDTMQVRGSSYHIDKINELYNKFYGITES